MIDSQGRIVFDSSDDANDASTKPKDRDGPGAEDDEANEDDMDVSAAETEKPEEDDDQDVEIDVTSLGARFFPSLSRLDEMDVCPSLKMFDLGDPSGSLDIPFLRAPEDWRQDQDKEKTPGIGDKSGMFIDEENPLGFDDTDGLGAFDLGADVDFGEGGEAWAREAALAPQMMRVFDAGLGGGVEGAEGDAGDMGIDLMLDANGPNGDFAVTMSHAQQADKMHEDILGYFDQALQKNWSSAEHWRIRKIKDIAKATDAGPTRPRKEKQAFEIDFAAPLDPALAETIYTPAATNTAISLPKKDWKSKSRNLLPDDRHFSSRQLLSLFLKPKARLANRKRPTRSGGLFGTAASDAPPADVPEGQMDEAFWASQKAPTAEPSQHDNTAPLQGDYDANFFQDDGLPFADGDDDDEDMDEFADARDHFTPGPDAAMTEVGMTGAFAGLTVTNPADLAFGTMLVTQSRRVRPEYVQYARKATKVDVRRLKENIWKGMGLERLEQVCFPLPPYCLPPGTNVYVLSNPTAPASLPRQRRKPAGTTTRRSSSPTS